MDRYVMATYVLSLFFASELYNFFSLFSSEIEALKKTIKSLQKKPKTFTGMLLLTK